MSGECDKCGEHAVDCKDNERIEWYHRESYIEKCPCCDLEQEILTQSDKHHTEIYLKCQCGEFIEFVLPVN